MKIRNLICSLALIALVPGLMAQGGAPGGMPPAGMGPGGAGAPAGRGGPSEPTTELGKHMSQISDAYRNMRGGATADATDVSKKDAALAQIAIIRENMTAALELRPDYTSAQPEDKQEQFVEDFHTQVRKFLAALEEFDAAVTAENSAEAGTLYARLQEIQREGHGTYRAPRGGGPGGGPGGMPAGQGMPGGAPGGRGPGAMPGGN